MERRLAAVLIADVVGYGRLSQIDEEGTRARFQVDLKEVFEPKISAHRGRLIKTMGDGLLVEFSSVVDALRCAVEAQQEKAKRNAPAPPEQRLDFRIGVNLGDIIVEGEDIHGDGVNIADRMQALAEPGGVAISGTAYDHVKTKLPVGYASLGEQKVKSIAEPVRVYRVVLDPGAAGKTFALDTATRAWRWPSVAAALIAVAVAVAALWARPWERWSDVSETLSDNAAREGPSLVVLPFDNLSDDKEQGYLADGITEDLTTDLARVPGLFVISRNAAFVYKGEANDPAEIATKLGVRYILEGSVRRAGDALRINAQLIDSTTGGHLWADRYEGLWSDVFALQDKVIESVVGSLAERLTAGGKPASVAQNTSLPGGTSNPHAYEAYLHGLELKRLGGPGDFAKAVALFKQAVDLDADYGRAWANLADVYWLSQGNPEREAALGVKNEAIMDKVHEFLSKSALHPSPLHHTIEVDLLLEQHKSEEAIVAAQRAIALDPGDPDGYEAMVQALIYDGRPEDGKAYLDALHRIDPRETSWRTKSLGLAYFTMGRFEAAIDALKKLDSNTDELWHRFQSLFMLVSAYAQLGDAEKAEAARKQLSRLAIRLQEANLSGLLARTAFPYKREEDMLRLLDGLRKAGVPDLPFHDWNSPDRLTGAQIRALVFGHEIEGRDHVTTDPWTRRTEVDGETAVSDGVGQDKGISWIEGDTICRWLTRRSRDCYAVFRNSQGAFETRDEYLWVTISSYNEFSVVR